MKAVKALFYFIGVFLVFGIAMLSISAFTLLSPGTTVDVIWKLNPEGLAQMLPYRIWIGAAFVLLAVFFIVADIGWFKKRKWGWRMVIGIFAANGAGDMLRLAKGDLAGGLLGIAIAGLILWLITRPKFKTMFR